MGGSSCSRDNASGQASGHKLVEGKEKCTRGELRCNFESLKPTVENTKLSGSDSSARVSLSSSLAPSNHLSFNCEVEMMWATLSWVDSVDD